MWKPEHRRAADRNDLRYPSDLTEPNGCRAHDPTPRQTFIYVNVASLITESH